MFASIGRFMVQIEPRLSEVFWVLLASAGINIITSISDFHDRSVTRLSIGIGITLLGVCVFFGGQCAKDVRDRARVLQVAEKRGTLQVYVLIASNEPGYDVMTRRSALWLLVGVLLLFGSISLGLTSTLVRRESTTQPTTGPSAVSLRVKTSEFDTGICDLGRRIGIGTQL